MKNLGKITGFALVASMAFGTAAPLTAASQPILGEITSVGFNFCPRGTANADGQLLAISQYTALFSLYGTTYGGDGRTSFGLPNLQGRVPIHMGRGPGLSDRRLGELGGTEANVLSVAQMPSHTHTGNILAAHTAAGDAANPKGNAFARSGAQNYVNDAAPSTDLADAMHSGTAVLAPSGASQPVGNMSPYLTIQYCVALNGIYPSRP